ncbi:MAG: HD domain-containing protein [Clostridia bacterium]|nr:HD domain-containing protein [Clostridia bacterium]
MLDGSGYHEDALIAVAFTGENLKIRATANFGWIPVGKPMTVTDVRDAYMVTKIDGRPAAEIYERYLGLSYEKMPFSTVNICEFPLTVEQDGVVMGRIPYDWTQEGALCFDVAMHVGDVIRFSYALPEQVLGQVLDDAEAFRAFGARGMFMSICMNRMLFLRDEEHLETDAYRAVVPGAVFLHGHSEIFYLHAGGEMHSTLVAVGFSEGETGKAAPEEQKTTLPRKEVIPLENRILTFMRAVTSDLETLTGQLIDLERGLENEVERKTRENESLSLHVVRTLAEAIDAKDEYTHGHSGRVAEYSKEIARRAGYSGKRQNEIYIMGLLHDVGKIGVPDAIINKPGRLTEEEFAEIKKHPEKGWRILRTIEEMPMLAIGARWHHERYDGKGYPDGLAGRDIPEEARIIGVADAYDAMTSNRSYRRSMDQDKVRGQIEAGKGTQFDPRFADIMIKMIEEDSEYRMRER